MIKYSHIINYIKVNGLLTFLTYLQFLSRDYFLLEIISFPCRDFILITIIDFYSKNKPYISNGEKREKEKMCKSFKLSLYNGQYIKDTLMVSLMDHIIYKYLDMGNLNSEITIFTFLYFILYSFYFELLFDLLHYLTHLSFHKITMLYTFHKYHHIITHPTSISTFSQHPVDYIISNIIPFLITAYIFPVKNSFILLMILMYKTYIEIAGHCGKNSRTCSFPQFIPLPKIFGIELYTIDHDNHHTKNNCNYAKRFTLWDKVFGTYHYRD